MKDAGIFDNDVVWDEEFVCKTRWQRSGRIKLRAAYVTFPDINPADGQTVEIWEVVVDSIKQSKA